MKTALALECKARSACKGSCCKGERGRTNPDEVDEFKISSGSGLSGVLKGESVYGGNLRYVSEFTQIPNKAIATAEKLSDEGKTPLYFVKGNKLLGIIAVADEIKEDSAEAVKELHNMGLHVVMLTGDNEKTANAVGKLAGVDEVIAGVLPDGKEKVVSKLKQKGRIAMVGDGINDAPALTSADVGIAIGAGTDVAIDAADVVLMKSRLADVPAAIRLGRATLRNIHENLFRSLQRNRNPIAAGLFIPLFAET